MGQLTAFRPPFSLIIQIALFLYFSQKEVHEGKLSVKSTYFLAASSLKYTPWISPKPEKKGKENWAIFPKKPAKWCARKLEANYGSEFAKIPKISISPSSWIYAHGNPAKSVIWAKIISIHSNSFPKGPPTAVCGAYVKVGDTKSAVRFPMMKPLRGLPPPINQAI